MLVVVVVVVEEGPSSLAVNIELGVGPVPVVGVGQPGLVVHVHVVGDS